MSVRNQSFFTGRTGSEIEMKYFESGGCVGNVSLAVDMSYKDKDGNKVDKTTWVNLVARDKVAEIIQKFVKKGDKIQVQCFYNIRTWTKDDGTKMYNHEFQVTSIELPDNKKD